MGEERIITVNATGNPFGGELDNPWPIDHPMAGERVAIFAFEVTRVDEDVEDIRRYHIAPASYAREGSIAPPRNQPQGTTIKWVGCGTGTVVRPIGEKLGDLICEVVPDDPQIV